jgi:hypothetical protein
MMMMIVTRKSPLLTNRSEVETDVEISAAPDGDHASLEIGASGIRITLDCCRGTSCRQIRGLMKARTRTMSMISEVDVEEAASRSPLGCHATAPTLNEGKGLRLNNVEHEGQRV